jgi:ribosomal subunit interface protein
MGCKMNFTLKEKNLKLTPSIYNYLVKKIDGLDKLLKKIGSPLLIEVEIGRESHHHRKGKVYRTEIQIRLPKERVWVEARGEDIFLTINQAKEKMERELKKYKEKQFSEEKRNRRRLKNILFWQKR